MVVSDENRFAFVCIAKAASTSIRRRFGFTATPENPDPPPHIYHMFLKDIIKQKPEAKDYFKFCFVRNPYDRLYSTYADFKYSLGHYWAKISVLREVLLPRVCLNQIVFAILTQ